MKKLSLTKAIDETRRRTSALVPNGARNWTFTIDRGSGYNETYNAPYYEALAIRTREMVRLCLELMGYSLDEAQYGVDLYCGGDWTDFIRNFKESRK